MIASRARTAAALLLATALVLPAGVAMAQTDDSQPLSLIPFDDDGAATTGSDNVSGQSQVGVSEIDGLEVESLAAVSAAAAGTIDINSGGFSMDLWQGTDAALIAALLPRLDPVDGSPTAAELARRLLLTVARPPESGTLDLLALRIARLNALGQYSAVPELVASAGRAAETAAVMAGLADARFLAGESEFACRDVRDGLALGEDVGLQKALVFCQRLAGEDAAAELGLAVLEDFGAAPESQFVALDQALAAGRRGTLDSLEGATPLVFAMALASDVAFDDALIASAPAGLQRAIADSTLIDMDARLHAGELATAAGTMPGSALAGLYEATSHDPAEVANALSRAGSMAGPSGRALLFRASSTQTLAAGRAEALAALLHHAAETGGAVAYLAAARAAADEISRLQPASELGWFSADASAALLLAGRPESAARWWPLLEDRAVSSPDFKARATALWPLFRIAFGEQLPGGAGMAGWWQSTAAQPGAHRLDLAETYLAAFSAFGDRAGTPIEAEVIALPEARQGVAPPAALLFAMGQAAHDGSIGETVLLALLALGPGGPSDADPVTLQAVIRALDMVGLGLEGRLIAMEAGGQRAIAKP